MVHCEIGKVFLVTHREVEVLKHLLQGRERAHKFEFIDSWSKFPLTQLEMVVTSSPVSSPLLI